MRRLTSLIAACSLALSFFLLHDASAASPLSDGAGLSLSLGRGTVIRARACTAHGAAVVVAPAVVYDAYHDVRVVPVAVSPEYYYSLNYYRDKLLVDAFAGRVEEILRSREILPPPTGKPPVAPKDATPPAPKGAGASDKLKALVSDKCLKCHSGATAKGGLVMDDLDSLSEVVRWRIYSNANKGTMPPGGPPIPDADIPEFLSYAESARAALKK